MWSHVMRRQFAVALGGFGRHLRRRPCLPPIDKLAERLFGRVDVFAFIGKRLEPDQFGLGLAFRAFEAVKTRRALSGDGIGADVEFDFPTALAAPADVARHGAGTPSRRLVL